MNRRFIDAIAAQIANATTGETYREFAERINAQGWTVEFSAALGGVTRHDDVQLDERDLSDAIDAGIRLVAETKVGLRPELARLREIILDTDWTEADHLEWVATAPTAEILSWAQQIAEARASE